MMLCYSKIRKIKYFLDPPKRLKDTNRRDVSTRTYLYSLYLYGKQEIKGLKALNSCMYKLKKYGLSPGILCQLFDAFVSSILNYGCEVWGFSKSKDIEKIHLKFLKLILGSMAVYGETGRYPLYIQRYMRIIKIWEKILYSNNVITKVVYKDMLVGMQNGQKNWASNVKNVFDMYGFSYIWDNQESFQYKSYAVLIKKRIEDEFLQKWYTSINSSSSLVLYRYFKSTFGYENYLDYLSNINKKYL